MTLVLAALQVLNIFVVTLSGFGLVSTSLLIYGLIQVSWQLNVIRHFNLIIIELLFDLDPENVLVSDAVDRERFVHDPSRSHLRRLPSCSHGTNS